MPFMKWESNYSVGIEEIDEQHKKLFGMVNDYFDAAKRQESNDALKDLFAGLSAYVLIHFRFEEKYFGRFNYENAEKHKNSHRELTEKLSDLLVKYDEGQLILAIEIGEFMRKWLISHICGTDQQYKECFQENWNSRKATVR